MWNQVYDPLNSQALSTIVAALPVVTLLVLIASNKVKAHWAAIIALIVASGNVPARDRFRRRDRLFPDRLDRVERYLSLPADGGEGCIRNIAEHHRGRHQ